MVLITIVFMGFINQLTSLGGPTLFSNRQAQELGRDASQYQETPCTSHVFFLGNMKILEDVIFFKGLELHQLKDFMGSRESVQQTSGVRSFFQVKMNMDNMVDG